METTVLWTTSFKCPNKFSGNHKIKANICAAEKEHTRSRNEPKKDTQSKLYEIKFHIKKFHWKLSKLVGAEIMQ